VKQKPKITDFGGKELSGPPPVGRGAKLSAQKYRFDRNYISGPVGRGAKLSAANSQFIKIDKKEFP